MENPFFVQLIRNIVLYHTRNGSLELSMIVPLRNEVRKRHIKRIFSKLFQIN